MTDGVSPAPKLALTIWGLITLGCMLGGVVLAVFSVQAEMRGRDVEDRWRRVQATVVDTSWTSSDPASHLATLEYTDEEGNDHQYRAAASNYAYDQETYEIYYDPEHPEHAVWPPGHSELWIPTVVFVFFGVVFLVIGIKVYR